jgi:HNH endonuclease
MTTYVSASLRREVAFRALNCCEYCLLHERNSFFAMEIDHIYAEKHRGKTVLDNLAFSCPDCNGYKGTDLASIDPEGEAITPLFHPRRQLWIDHFTLQNGLIEPLTPEGRVTVLLLQMNLPDRVEQRQILSRIGKYPGSRS